MSDLTIEKLGLAHLTKEQRLHLIGELWDSLSPYEDDLFPDHQNVVLERLQRAEQSPETRILWDDALARLRSRS